MEFSLPMIHSNPTNQGPVFKTYAYHGHLRLKKKGLHLDTSRDPENATIPGGGQGGFPPWQQEIRDSPVEVKVVGIPLFTTALGIHSSGGWPPMGFLKHQKYYAKGLEITRSTEIVGVNLRKTVETYSKMPFPIGSMGLVYLPT